MRLLTAIETYVQRKRESGLLFKKGEQTLMSLLRHCTDRPLHELNARHVSTFLNEPCSSTATWRKKYGILNHFFEFWSARDAIAPVLMPPPRLEERQTFTPYIYSRVEVRALLKKTRVSQRASLTLDARTLRTLVLFLYASGARVGEAVDLKMKDVDLRSGDITFRETRFNRKRCIPIAADLLKVLQAYVKTTRGRRGEESHLFIRKDGSPLVTRTLNGIFSRLRRLADILRNDGSIYQPRMHDLRSTFAVHRITSWIKEGRDLNRMLPALSAYIGQAGLISTERYLSLTPERFRKELDRLSPTKPKKKWRNDLALMKFLATL